MYDTMLRHYYWPNISNDVHQVVRNCRSCAATRDTHMKRQKLLKLFTAKGPLEFIALDILGPLPKTKSGYNHGLIIPDRYSKMARSIPMKTTTASRCSVAFVEHWVLPYGIPDRLLTDNGPHLISKFVASMCLYLGIKQTTTTAYHTQTNGQAERYNRTLVTGLQHYVCDHQDDWDKYVQPLTYEYNTHVHRSTGIPPFDMVITRRPTGKVIGQPSSALSSNASSGMTPRSMRSHLLCGLSTMFESADKRLRIAQFRFKKNADATVRFLLVFQAGDEVYID